MKYLTLFMMLLVALLSGCQTAGALRVNVEVYKGPLVDETRIQQEKLIGLLTDIPQAGLSLVNDINISMCHLGCFDKFEPGPKAYSSVEFDSRQQLILSLSEEIEITAKKIETLNKIDPTNSKTLESLKGQKADQELLKSLAEKDLENSKATSRSKRGEEPKSPVRDARAQNFCGGYTFDIPNDNINKGNPKKPKDDEIFQQCQVMYSLHKDITSIAQNYNSLSLYPKIPSPRHWEPFKNIWAYEVNINSKGKPHQNPVLDTGKAFDAELYRAARLSEFMRARARYWATEHTATYPDSKRVRISMANFAQFTASYGNRIAASVDAIEKQSKLDLNSNLLPTSVFLRDASPTAYLNLYEWNNAAVDQEDSDPTERIRIVESLVNDTYWTEVNSVFAKGQGEFSVALIKDSIGNWNIKNFSNDPSELLDAYKNAGLAVLKTATDLATSNISGSEKLFNLSNQLVSGESSTASSKSSLDQLRQNVAIQVMQIGNEHKNKRASLDKEITELAFETKTMDGCSVSEKPPRIVLEECGKKKTEISGTINIEEFQLTQQKRIEEQALVDLRSSTDDTDREAQHMVIAEARSEINSISTNIKESRQMISTYQSTAEEIQREQMKHDALIQQRDALHPAMLAELGRIISFYEYQIGSLQESIISSGAAE